jgi:hypothetical protein
MHLKVFLKLKNRKNSLFGANIKKNQKKTKKPQKPKKPKKQKKNKKTPKTQKTKKTKKNKKNSGLGCFKKTRVFSNPDTRSAWPVGSAGASASA